MKNDNYKIPLSSEALGRKGEKRFSELCTDAGLIVNKSEEDIMGWDFLIEYPYLRSNSTLPLDQRDHPPQCKIQVKTIASHNRSVTLTLSAAERIAKHPGPSFIAIMMVNSDLSFKGIKFIHITENYLSKIFQRLTKANHENSLSINKITINFDVSSASDIIFTGDSISQYLTKAVGSSMNSYTNNKAEQLENLGYDSGRYSIKIDLGNQTEEQINEMFLGMRTLDYASLETSETRFGFKRQLQSSTSGKVSVTPTPFRQTVLELTGIKSREKVRMKGNVYFSPATSSVENIILRIETAMMNIMLYNDKITYTNREEYFTDIPLSLDIMLNSFSGYKIMIEGGGSLKASINGKLVYAGTCGAIDGDASIHTPEKTISILKKFKHVVNYGDIQIDRFIYDNIVHNQAPIRLLYDVIKHKNISMDGFRIFNVDNSVKIPKQDGILIGRMTFIDFSIVFYILVSMEFTPIENGYKISMTDFVLRDISDFENSGNNYNEYCELAKLTTGVTSAILISFGLNNLQ